MSETPTIDADAPYQRWLRGVHSPAHARRTAARNAAFFLAHLQPGMRLLDAGCGPGSITIGLAEALGPDGEATGVDINPDVIISARALAAERSCANVQFCAASVYELPYPDAAFDAAFSHAVMQHLPSPLDALREIRRVLRPGGVIGIADADHDGTVMWPPDPLLDASFELIRDLRLRSGGGDPRTGKQLRSMLHEAGFARAEATVSADCDGTSEATRRAGSWWAAYLRSPELRTHASGLGLASDDQIEGMALAWEHWGASTGAFWARFWCQAVAWR